MLKLGFGNSVFNDEKIKLFLFYCGAKPLKSCIIVLKINADIRARLTKRNHVA
jgi:hypothetical protein